MTFGVLKGRQTAIGGRGEPLGKREYQRSKTPKLYGTFEYFLSVLGVQAVERCRGERTRKKKKKK